MGGGRLTIGWREATFAVVTLAALAAPADADEDRAPTPEQLTERTAGLDALWTALRRDIVGTRLQADQQLVSSGEFDGARARWGRFGWAADAGIPIRERWHVGVSPSVAVERLRFDGSDEWLVSQFGRQSRLGDFLEAALHLGTLIPLDFGLGAELLVGATLRQEVGAAFDDSLQIGGSLAATYERGDWLRLRLGLGLGADLGDQRLRFSPVYRVQVRPDPRWRLEVSGLRGRIAWRVSRRVELELGGGLESTQYRLKYRSRPPVGLGSGALQRRQARIGLSATIRLDRWVRLRPTLGLVLDEELSVLDEEGTELDARHERDPSVVAGLRVELRP